MTVRPTNKKFRTRKAMNEEIDRLSKKYPHVRFEPRYAPGSSRFTIVAIHEQEIGGRGNIQA